MRPGVALQAKGDLLAGIIDVGGVVLREVGRVHRLFGAVEQGVAVLVDAQQKHLAT